MRQEVSIFAICFAICLLKILIRDVKLGKYYIDLYNTDAVIKLQLLYMQLI